MALSHAEVVLQPRLQWKSELVRVDQMGAT